MKHVLKRNYTDLASEKRFPYFQLPLQSEDIEPIVDLQSLLHGIYNRARYYLAIYYNKEPVPPLKSEDAVWPDTLLRKQGLRNN